MRRLSGFTLVELLIVLAIIGTLAAIVIPSYVEYIQRAKISEAINSLSEMRTRMERHFQDYRCYGPPNDPACALAACTATSQAPLPATTDGGFSFACPELTASTFLITASGSGDLAGLVYSISNRNIRATVSVPAGWTNTAGNCWVKTKAGTC